MKDIRRSLIALALAALVPMVVFAAILVIVLGHREQNAIEARAQAQVRQISADIDRFVAAQFQALETMAQADALQRGDPVASRAYAARLKARESMWQAVVLSDLKGRRLFDLHAPSGPALPPFEQSDSFQAAIRTARPVIGNYLEGGGTTKAAFVPLHGPVVVDGAARYVVTIALDPHAMDLLFAASGAPRSWVGGVVDQDGRLIFRSERAEEFVGRPAAPATREALGRGTHGIYEGRTLDDLDVVFAFTTSPLTGWSVHYAVPRALYETPVRRTLWIVVPSGIAVMVLAGLLALLIGREIAHRRALEAASAQSQKLEALGRFTGGIAHDFNNLLMAVLGNLELAAKRLGDHPATRQIERARQAALRGARLNDQLLGFARQRHMEPQRAELNATIESASELVRSSVAGTVEIWTRLQPGLWPAMADPTQIEMAVINLALNARDAMPAGGTLTLQTANVPAGDARLPAGHESRDHVMIAVSDTGVGMSEEVRSRVLEPFFTTKPPGQGTGLGLSQVHGIVTQLGGALAIDSAPGAGTTVRILLPRLMASAPESAGSAAAPPPSMALGLRVLLVDDDEQVRGATLAMLQSLGCEVSEAASGEMALSILRGGRTVDVMMTDYAMPTMLGTELIEQVRKAGFEFPTVMMTGYVDAITDGTDVTFLLRKPFTAADLAAALRRCVGDRVPA